jgi:hypothetical protein
VILDNTPLELYNVQGVPVLVKREDLCAPPPGPSFSKVRGVMAHLKSRSEGTIGVLDTYHSKAGQAVAWACRELGKGCVDFWPYYKAEIKMGPCGAGDHQHVMYSPDGYVMLREPQRNSRNLGAHLLPLPAGRSAILYHRAKKELAQGWSSRYMMPNALKLPESVSETAAEVVRTAPLLPPSGTIVISVSSGTVAAGVVRGLAQAGLLPLYQVVLHLGYSRSREQVARYLNNAAGGKLNLTIRIIDEGYGYKDKARPLLAPCPFPSNEYYDLKAWRWLQMVSKAELEAWSPIVFWNIGD